MLVDRQISKTIKKKETSNFNKIGEALDKSSCRYVAFFYLENISFLIWLWDLGLYYRNEDHVGTKTLKDLCIFWELRHFGDNWDFWKLGLLEIDILELGGFQLAKVDDCVRPLCLYLCYCFVSSILWGARVAQWVR